MGFGDLAQDALEDTITELRSLLADLQGIDLWPPWDAADDPRPAGGAGLRDRRAAPGAGPGATCGTPPTSGG